MFTRKRPWRSIPTTRKRMRKALAGIGARGAGGHPIHQHSGAVGSRCARYLKPETHRHASPSFTLIHYRNAPYGGWTREIPADCDPQHVDWKAFEGEATAAIPLTRSRFINWRFFWDYDGSNVL